MLNLDFLKNMKIRLLFFIVIGTGVLGFLLYSYVGKQNEITKLRIKLPSLAEEVKKIEEENIRLQYEISSFNSPSHLMQLSEDEKFGKFKHPPEKEIVILENR